jgi:aspartate kinase
MAIQSLGGKAQSYLGHQVRIKTDSAFSKARILSIDADALVACLGERQIAIIAGFQGIDKNRNITTLGRGGSDTTAVAIAAALKADVCEIYTDVDGVYTTDPNIVSKARKLDRISYDEMLEMASLGAKVLHIRSVAFAKKYNVPLHVRSSFNDKEGTMVIKESEEMERVIVTGVTYNRDEAKVTIIGVPDSPEAMHKIFTPISEANINVDMIVKASSTDKFTDFSFTVPKSDFRKSLEIVQQIADSLGAVGIESDPDVAKVSIIGVGMRTHTGIATTLFRTYAQEGIEAQIVSTSEIKISTLIEEKYMELAVRSLHDAFELESVDLSEECLVCDGG